MSEQYFKSSPTSQHSLHQIQDGVAGLTLSFQTDNGVFSKQRMDYGSKVLVEAFADSVPAGSYQIVELGSGYGPVTIALAKLYPQAQVTGVEINERAYQLAQANSQLNRVENTAYQLADAGQWQASQAPDFVVTNPPIRAGKQVIQQFVRSAQANLRPGGELWLVIQKKQGAPSMETFMEEVFLNVELVTRDKGYWILKSQKTK